VLEGRSLVIDSLWAKSVTGQVCDRCRMNYSLSWKRSCVLVMAFLASQQCLTFADEKTSALPGKLSQVNVPMKTLGGRQLWGDVHFFQGWTIQRNIFTGHFRLLDPRDVRHAWGNFEACKKKLDVVRKERKLAPMKGEAVVLLHGQVHESTLRRQQKCWATS